MMQYKKYSINIQNVLVIAIIGLATLLRLVLVCLGWPAPQGDESIMDLIALHIVNLHQHPTFYYGQNYMAPIEAYLAAPLFALFGPSILLQRLALLPFFILFLICMYFLVRMLYTPRFALFSIALLGLGSSEMLLHQVRADGGYPEIVFFSALIFLLCIWLASTAPSITQEQNQPAQLKRSAVYVLLGLTIGLALWDDELILPCIAAAGILLVLFCWRELLRWAWLYLLPSAALGALPLIIYNLHAKPGQNSLDVLRYLHSVGFKEVAEAHITLLQKLTGVFLFSISTALGVNPCHRSVNLPLFGPASGNTLTCTLLQGGWSLGYCILWVAATLLIILSLWKLRPWRARWFSQEGTRLCSQLLLLASGAMWIFSFASSNAGALYPITSSRYLICLLLTIPAVLWPLWKGCSRLSSTYALRERIPSLLKLGLLMLVFTTFLVGTIDTFTQVPSTQAVAARDQALVHDLLRLGATRIYSDYWTCNPIMFASNEKIICMALWGSLTPGYNRYPPYVATVNAVPHPTYVLPAGSDQAATFLQQHGHDTHYQRYDLDGFLVYVYKGGP